MEAPRFRFAERRFAADIGRLEENILEHCDHPQIELQILQFLNHSHGPTVEGIAAEMGLGVAAAEYHLERLSQAHRIWKQLGLAGRIGWHITSEGRRLLLRFSGVLAA